eukprot:CAMPEP_0198350966 /NCGR_PEP_ID=MMETSP1450-20131203/101074_1 /TAXON_ID=753684 ORGANISM="Madagascaria erythrocladiodes, Strain CCMP3234" /NCGR_SAMPLE_ID=MMETSP1450 /ASSEMBLY_ACC=CAM_ASM_001115 /LENGTH=177 /DNA_ID=CAMNT_0044056841 /DNA_START=17 /DNA_END=547 /DNA_ORIENTATION=+
MSARKRRRGGKVGDGGQAAVAVVAHKACASTSTVAPAVARPPSWPTRVVLYADAALFFLLAFALMFYPDETMSHVQRNEEHRMTPLGQHQTRSLGQALFITSCCCFVFAGARAAEARVLMVYMVAYGVVFASAMHFVGLKIEHGNVKRGLARGPYDYARVLLLRVWYTGALAVTNAV